MDFSTCLSSAQVDLEALENMLPDKDGAKVNPVMLKEGLKHLKKFHLCARKLGNDDGDDASSRALLARIEDVVCKIAQDVHPLHPNWDDDLVSTASQMIYNYRYDILSFKPEIHQWYINFSDYFSRKSSSSPPNRDELLEFLECLSDCWLPPADSLYWDEIENNALINLLEALEEKILFLKNFIRFTTLRGGGTDADDRHLGQNLFIHIRAVAVNAAHYSYMSQIDIYDEDEDYSIKFMISDLPRRIKPVDLQVFETYVQALTVSKLSGQSHSATLKMDDEHILEDFIDSFLSNLWEILTTNTFPVFSTKDQLQYLYEGLGSLRTILKKQAKNFDEKMWDLTRIVVCDAGRVIFSLSLEGTGDGLAKEMNQLFLGLLERIHLIRADVEEISPEESMFNFPKVYEMGFIDFQIENLMELTSSEADSTSIAKHQIQTIYQELEFLQPFLEKILELRNVKGELQALWNRAVELVNRVEFLIDSTVIGDISGSFPMSCDSIAEEIKILKLDAFKIFDMEGLDVKVKKVTKRSNDFLPLERSVSIIKDEIVGLDDEVRSIMDRLRLQKGANQLQIIAIVGMPGLGKTTLAKLVYNNSSIRHDFHICAWCCISQV